MTWHPSLEPGPEPIYLRLLHAIERDVHRGLLRPGDKLPPQRDLSYRMSIGVGTVMRAYEEAARRGLVTAQIGRGSFIANRDREASSEGAAIDLSINHPPLDRANAELAAHLRILARRGIGEEIGSYSGPVGSSEARQAGAKWMQWAGKVADAPWQRIAFTLGAQQAMDQALAALAPPGAPILCEELTYWGAKAQASYRGNPLHGVAMDADGLLPDALEAAVAATGARVLYCTPTLQNPTATIMSKARREEIAKLARKLDLWIVEDDIYAPYARGREEEPLVNLAPERTAYVTSLSKAVLPGLRAGYLLMPDEKLLETVALGLRATICSSPGLTGTIATDWIIDGRAQAIAEETVEEVSRRTTTALDELEGHVCDLAPVASLHLWLPMSAVECGRAHVYATGLGLILPDPETPRVGEASPHGLRISIGAPRSQAKLATALGLLKQAINPARPRYDRAVV